MNRLTNKGVNLLSVSKEFDNEMYQKLVALENIEENYKIIKK